MDSSESSAPNDDYSLRSRASSIISTGTKVSLAPTFLTTPFNPQPLPRPASVSTQAPLFPSPEDAPREEQPRSNVIDVLLGRRNFRISARPGSILSISSYDVPAPPYSEALNAPPVGTSILERAGTHGGVEVESDDEDGGEDLSSTLRLTRPRVQIRPSTSDTDSTATDHERRRVVHDDDDDDGYETPLSPLDMDPHFQSTPNAISAHYTNIVRTIDGNHRNEVLRLENNHQAQLIALQSAHDTALSELEATRQAEIREMEAQRLAEISALRSELLAFQASELSRQRNEQDAVYRGEFGRLRQEVHELQAQHDVVLALKDQVVAKSIELNDTIDTLEARVTELEAEKAEMEKEAEVQKERLEKVAEDRERAARNEVEDVWEKRWIERMNLAKEQVGKVERIVALVLEECEKKLPGIGAEVEDVARRRAREEEAAAKKERGKGRKWGSFKD